LLRRDVRDWETRNLRFETHVAEVQRTSHGQGGRFNPINKVLALRLEDNEYNKPEGRAVDRYGLEWSCPGEPYGFDLRGPGAAYARTPSTKSHSTSSRADSTTRSSAQDSVSSRLATTSRQPRNTERATRKRPGPHAEG